MVNGFQIFSARNQTALFNIHPALTQFLKGLCRYNPY